MTYQRSTSVYVHSRFKFVNRFVSISNDISTLHIRLCTCSVLQCVAVCWRFKCMRSLPIYAYIQGVYTGSRMTYQRSRTWNVSVHIRLCTLMFQVREHMSFKFVNICHTWPRIYTPYYMYVGVNFRCVYTSYAFMYNHVSGSRIYVIYVTNMWTRITHRHITSMHT